VNTGEKDKGKGFPAYAMKASRECKGIAPFILNLSNTLGLIKGEYLVKNTTDIRIDVIFYD